MPLQGVDLAAELAAEYQPKAGRQAKVTLALLLSCSIGAIVALLSTALPNGSLAQASEHKIVVASKIDTEGALLGNMILALLEAHGLAVEKKIQLGPTNIVRAAILAGQIDLYPEYTGNGAVFFHREADPVWKHAEAGYAAVRGLDRAETHLVWLAPAPANNTWVIAIRNDLPEFPSGKCLD